MIESFNEIRDAKEMRDVEFEGERSRGFAAESKKMVGLIAEMDSLKMENIQLQSNLKCMEMQRENETKYLENELTIMGKAMANAKVTIAQLTCEKEHVENQYRILLRKKGGK